MTEQVLKDRNTEDLCHLTEVSRKEDFRCLPAQRGLWATRAHANPEAPFTSYHLSKLKEDTLSCPGQNVDVSAPGSNPAKPTFTPRCWPSMPRQTLPRPHWEKKPVKQALQGQPPRGNEIFFQYSREYPATFYVIKKMTHFTFWILTQEILVYPLNGRELSFLKVELTLCHKPQDRYYTLRFSTQVKAGRQCFH